MGRWAWGWSLALAGFFSPANRYALKRHNLVGKKTFIYTSWGELILCINSSNKMVASQLSHSFFNTQATHAPLFIRFSSRSISFACELSLSDSVKRSMALVPVASKA